MSVIQVSALPTNPRFGTPLKSQSGFASNKENNPVGLNTRGNAQVHSNHPQLIESEVGKQNQHLKTQLWLRDNKIKSLEKRVKSQEYVHALKEQVLSLEDKVESLESELCEFALLYEEAKNEIELLRSESSKSSYLRLSVEENL